MEQTVLTTKEEKSVKEVVEKLFATLEIDGGFTLSSNGDTLDVLMDTKDTGIVIGYHGEVLEALQLVTALVVARKLGRFVRISIEVDGYKQHRVEYLEKLAIDAKERALSENREQVLMGLRSWERRVVHMYLQNDDEVVSESSGEGRDRVLIVKPK